MNNENIFNILKERGFIEQTTSEEKIKNILDNEKVNFYIGFDPTADSLHVGHFLTIMAMAHMQKNGHKPIVLVGGATAIVGDPTGRTDMRKLMTKDEIEHNANCFKKQLSKFINFENDKAIMVNNADWLMDLKYISFLHEYGKHFSVNKMLTAESYKTRLEKGLSFLEFNYMLLQSYDFLELNRKYNCILQIGGNDQWSNIISGVDLIRRLENKESFGLTLSLLTTNDNKKMGKTQNGAIWLDPNKTTPYEFYQYFRNIEDSSVHKCLSLLTFLPIKEVNELGSLKGKEINKAKEILAFEVTKIVHSEQDAKDARTASDALFSGSEEGGSIPETILLKSDYIDGINILTVLEKTNLISSQSDGRRLIKQGGIKINEIKIEDFNHTILISEFSDDCIMIKKGKKTFHKLILK